MSLYGDLPPPSSSGDSDSTTIKKQLTETKDGSNPGSSTSAKSALPAGWSSSVTRFKPMLNRKLAPPKPKQNIRSIPAGFVAQTKSEIQTTPTHALAVSASTMPSSIKSTEQQSGQKTLPSSESTLDESSWLKARTAQVQRQDIDGLATIRKQMKKQPVKGQPGMLSLDDDYDIARPNEYEEFKVLFEEEQRFKEEEKQRLRDQNRSSGGRSRRSRSRSYSASPHSYSHSRGRGHSRSRSYSRSRSRSQSRGLSRSRSRSPNSRYRSRSPLGSNNAHGTQNHDHSRSPSSRTHISGRYGSAASFQRNRRSNSRSRSPPSKRNRSRSGSPSYRRRRTPSPSQRRYRHSPSPTQDEQAPGRASTYKAFAPPVEQVNSSASLSSSGTQHAAPIAQHIMQDISGEDAFLRRARLSQNRAAASTVPPQPQPQPKLQSHHQSNQMNEQQNRNTFIPKKPQNSLKGSPSNVILLTNMVGPGEVDDTLQEETAGECAKYGSVVRCLIFEVQNGKVPAEEAVRIFVKFGNVPSAERALRDLDGRFFGGRQVHCQYFDEKRFDLLQLAP